MSLRSRYKNSLVSKILIGGIILVLLLQSLLVMDHFFGAEWAPLGDYPLQSVESPHASAAGLPLVFSNEDVTVEATKCNDSPDPVKVYGSVTWRTVDPSGTSIETSSNAPGEREPGCHDFKYANPIPPEVLARTADLEKSGREVVWKITGYEQPVSDDGSLGVGASCETESFIIKTATQ